MASNVRIFFAGAATTFIVLAISFGGGLMLATSPKVPSAPSRAVADRLPPARVILPTPAEPPTAPQVRVESASAIQPPSVVSPVKDVEQVSEKDRRAERAERRKSEAEERLRRKKYAERNARRGAARQAKQQEQQQQQAGILAFGQRDDGQSRGEGGLFGN
jgi:type IV secretory pathway VirB10-like protein